MKIAVTAKGDTLEAAFDQYFGRAQKFLVYDTETKEHFTISNQQNLNSPQGAGIQAAETIIRAGATHLITGHCGPKAFRVLKAAHILIYHTNVATVSEALEQFTAGNLTEVQSADIEGHWV